MRLFHDYRFNCFYIISFQKKVKSTEKSENHVKVATVFPVPTLQTENKQAL